MSQKLLETLGNKDWLVANTAKIKAALPQTWTHMKDVQVLKLSFQFKVIGIDWRTEDEFGKIMVYLERIGIMERDRNLIRAKP